jgi:hypothetical protein
MRINAQCDLSKLHSPSINSLLDQIEDGNTIFDPDRLIMVDKWIFESLHGIDHFAADWRVVLGVDAFEYVDDPQAIAVLEETLECVKRRMRKLRDPNGVG